MNLLGDSRVILFFVKSIFSDPSAYVRTYVRTRTICIFLGLKKRYETEKFIPVVNECDYAHIRTVRYRTFFFVIFEIIADGITVRTVRRRRHVSV